MKTLFLPATLKFNKELFKKIKIKNFKVVTTIQYLKEVKKHFKNAKQILGCSKFKKTNTFLYIGTGSFHPLRLTKYSKNIHILNPETKQFYKLEQSEIQTYKKQQKGKLIKFYSSKTYGIIVSTKPHQYNLKTAVKLKNKLKNSFIFLTNNIEEEQLQNFPQIQCWINTACPRINYKNIINLEDLPIKL